MKRIAPIGLSAFALAGLLAATGCDSGGIETGVPSDTTSQSVPKDKMPQLIPITPPGTTVKKDASTKGAIAPPTTAPEASKEAPPK